MSKKLVIILGPTAVGKTALTLWLAEKLKTEIISADARQIYKHLNIGTAKPSVQMLQKIKHHCIDFLPLTASYSAGIFAKDVLKLLQNKLFKKYPFVLMTGGAGLYIQAVCEGFNDLPNNFQLKKQLNAVYQKEGLSFLVKQLLKDCPDIEEKIDLKNPHRVIRALEIYQITQKSPHILYKKQPARNFKILKIGLAKEKNILYQKIEDRVEAMMQEGLLTEAKKFYAFKNYQALQTVGYREMFDYLDCQSSLEEAIVLIKRNTQRYAKRQMTWFKKDPSIMWFDPNDRQKILKSIQLFLNL